MIMSNSKNSSTGYDGYPSSQEICRICHCEAEPSLPLISPCSCCGSLQYVHQSCLQQWIKSSDTRQCELCKFPFVMRTKTKPLRKWENLELGTLERRRLAFSVLLHIVGIGCVVWSLYVLVERAAQEVTEGELKWPFWTKLFVVGVGFGGGLVVMYIQCKTYLQLCHRWKAFNRVIYVQNAPEKVPLWYSDFQVISPSTSSKYRRNSGDNNSEIRIPLEDETISLRENITAHHSLTDIVIAGRLPEEDRYTNVGRYISPSKSVSDVTAVHYGPNKDLKKAKSVASGLPKQISLSVFKTSTKASPSTNDDEDTSSAVVANPNRDSALESSPLLPAQGTQSSFSPSSTPPNLVIVHESEDRGDSQTNGDIN